jgi:RNA polymerase sigma factor (sigma-70 family)
VVEKSSISSSHVGRVPMLARGAPMPGSALPNLLLRTQSDDRLVELVRGGSERAFATIVERYRGELIRYSSRFVDRNLAEDVVQQALMNALGSLRRDARAIALRPWLYRICHNVALNECRRTRSYEELDENIDGVPQPPDVAQGRENLKQLVQHMTALPARQREALTAYELEGRGYAEIAATMDTGQSAVRGLIARARTHLRDACGALVPLPLLRQLAQASGAGAPAATAAATAGGAGLVVKAAAVVTAATVVATGGVALKTQTGRVDSARASASEAVASPAHAAAASVAAGIERPQGAAKGLAVHAQARGVAGRQVGHHGAAAAPGSVAASDGSGSGADGSTPVDDAAATQATADGAAQAEAPPPDESAPPPSEAPVDPPPDHPPPDPPPAGAPPPP